MLQGWFGRDDALIKKRRAVENLKMTACYSVGMKGVLTTTERDEVVTKGYFHYTLENVLEEKDYVTKDFLRQQDYVNHTTFNDAITLLLDRMDEQFEEYKRHVSALHEYHLEAIRTIAKG